MDQNPANYVTVDIYDQTYHLSGEDAEHIRKLAALVDAKMRAVAAQGRTVDSLRVAVLAALNLALGNQEGALRWLEVTAPGDFQANWLSVDPAFDSIRTHPRFVAVVNRVGVKKD